MHFMYPDGVYSQTPVLSDLLKTLMSAPCHTNIRAVHSHLSRSLRVFATITGQPLPYDESIFPGFLKVSAYSKSLLWYISATSNTHLTYYAAWNQ